MILNDDDLVHFQVIPTKLIFETRKIIKTQTNLPNQRRIHRFLLRTYAQTSIQSPHTMCACE